MARKKKSKYLRMPILANKYLRSPEGRNAELIVYKFHAWLHANNVIYGDITPQIVSDFLNCPQRKQVSNQTKYNYRSQLIPYLCHLYSRKKIGFDPDLMRNHPKNLPEEAIEFLDLLSATHKLSTIGNYSSSLRKLHAWMKDEALDFRMLNRDLLRRFHLTTIDGGLAPSTRLDNLTCIRVYLRWLETKKRLRISADELIPTSDLPKLPSYLPRPFSPQEDREIQARLWKIGCQYSFGLLLMRFTGIRIGELASLTKNCLAPGHDGKPYLKVPLGKMNTERLVPIDAKTHDLIRHLQIISDDDSDKLLSKEKKSIPPDRYRELLREITGDMNLAEPAVPHRMRHTYATTLLNAGVSLVTIMKLLGHHDYRMTLRYSAILGETVGKEYFEAIERMRHHSKPIETATLADASIDERLNEAAKWLQTQEPNLYSPHRKRAKNLVQRINRIRNEIKMLRLK